MKNPTPRLCKAKYVVLCLLLSLGTLGTIHADTQVGRYITVSDKPTAEQRDLLQVKIQVEFPEESKSVGDALRTLLSKQGLRLGSTRSEAHRQQLKRLLKQPLPAVHRNLGPMSLKDALETLAGPAWSLVYDPMNRLVSFKICRYRSSD